MHSYLRCLFQIFASILLLFSAFEVGADQADHNQKIVISVDLDGVLVQKSSQGRPGLLDHPIFLPSRNAWYSVNTEMVRLLKVLSAHPNVILVVYSAGDAERTEEILSRIPLTEGSGQKLREVIAKIYSRADLVPASPRLEVGRSPVYRSWTQEKPADRGYKDLTKVARDFGVDSERVLHIDNDGRFIFPGQEAQWIRTPNYKTTGSFSALAFGQIYSHRLKDGRRIWDILGPVSWQGDSFLPGSGSPQPTSATVSRDFYLPLPHEEYVATRTIGLDVLHRYPRDQYHYLILGRSPIGPGRFLERIDPNSVSYLAYSGGHFPGVAVTGGKTRGFGVPVVYPPLDRDQEQTMFDYFKATLPDPRHLKGKKIVVLDYLVEDFPEGFESFFRYLAEFKNQRNYPVSFEGFGILNESQVIHKEKQIAGFPVVVHSYGQSGEAVTRMMYGSKYEAAAPYGRYLPSEDLPPAPSSIRLPFELFGYNLHQTMHADQELPSLLSPDEWKTYQSNKSHWDAKLAAMKDLRLLRYSSAYLPYLLDQILSVSAEKKSSLMLSLIKQDLAENRAYKVDDLLAYILPRFSESDRQKIVPRIVEELLARPFLGNEIYLLVEMFPENLLDRGLIKQILTKEYRADGIESVLNFLVLRYPDPQIRSEFLGIALSKLEPQNFIQGSAEKALAEKLRSRAIQAMDDISQDAASALGARPSTGISCRAVFQ
jgi:hypothetical protein